MGYPVFETYKFGARAAQIVPERFARGANSLAMHWAAGREGGPRRAQVERNLRRVHGPSYGGEAMQRSVAKTFEYYGRYWLESFRLPSLSTREVDLGFGYEGIEPLIQAVEHGPGPLMIIPHLGGWEWAAFWLTKVMGIQVTAIVEPVEPPELFDWFVSYRESLGMHIVPLGPEAGPAVLKAIKERHVICLLSDRDLLGNGAEVEFFGEKTTLPAGAATLALRTGAPLLPVAIYFREPFGCHGVIRPQVPAERQGRLRDDVQRITQDLAYELEHLVRAAPEQWHLMQPNWPSDFEALGIERGSGPVGL